MSILIGQAIYARERLAFQIGSAVLLRTPNRLSPNHSTQPQEPHLLNCLYVILPWPSLVEDARPRFRAPELPCAVALATEADFTNMDLFEECFSPAALSAASPFVEPKTTTSVETPSQHLFVFHEFPSGERGVREITRQQWETFKPLIQQIYIDKSKPFPYLAKILRDEYGFEPTYDPISSQPRRSDQELTEIQKATIFKASREMGISEERLTQ